MIAGSLLSLTLLLAAPPQPEPTPLRSPAGVPLVSLAELNAFVDAGNYHRIRIEKLGHVLEATGNVKLLTATGDLPIVELPGFLSAALNGLPKDHGLLVGDRVRFRGMIVNEGYACLQIWTYGFEKLPPSADEPEEPANTETPSKPATLPGAKPPAIRMCEAAPVEPEPPAPSPASLAKSSEAILPKVTVGALDAAKQEGDYLRVRREKIGHRLIADAVVEKVGAWPLVRLSDHWQAHLHSHSSDMGLKEGDRVRLQGLIVAEAYSAVTVWVERIEKLSAEVEPAK